MTYGLVDALKETERERDQAREECERLRTELAHVTRCEAALASASAEWEGASVAWEKAAREAAAERDAALARAESLAAELATAHSDARDADDAEALLRAWMSDNGDREKTQQWMDGENPWWREANADARALEAALARAERLRGEVEAARSTGEYAEECARVQQQRAEQAERELDDARRLAEQWRAMGTGALALDIDAHRFPWEPPVTSHEQG